ncbi:MAG: hypothetical protein AB7P04_04740 [Bacteriovoracia bacterium]
MNRAPVPGFETVGPQSGNVKQLKNGQAKWLELKEAREPVCSRGRFALNFPNRRPGLLT